MAIDLDFHHRGTDGVPSCFLVVCEDLSQIFRAVLVINQTATVGMDLLRYCHLGIDVTPLLNGGVRIKGPTQESIDASLQRLLEPFRRLHSVGNVIITGSVDRQYREDIIASLSATHIGAHALVDMVTVIGKRGDDFVHAGDYAQAYSTYMAALDSGYVGYRLPSQAWEVDGGTKANLSWRELLRTLCSKLQTVSRRLK